jgi:hypothetical protein
MNVSRHTYETSTEKTIDFLMGFVGWWVANVVFAAITQFVVPLVSLPLNNADPSLAPLFTVISLALSCLPLLVNVAAIVAFAFTRYWVALGALAGFGSALVIALCIGLVVGAICFAALASYSALGP